MSRDASDQSAEDEWGDDDLDEAEEDVAEHAQLYREGGRVEAEFEAGEHGEEDPEGERSIAQSGDCQQEQTETADYDEGFVSRKRNEQEATGGEEQESGGDENFALA